jgi:hypothetical protein
MPSTATNIVPFLSGNARQMTAEDLAALREAAEHLEHPSLAARLSNVVGTPIEMALQMLPRRWYRRIHRTAESVIEKALAVAVSSMHVEREGAWPAGSSGRSTYLPAGPAACSACSVCSSNCRSPPPS